MILLNSVIEVLAGTMTDFATNNLTNNPSIGGVFIGRHALRFVPDRRDGLLEEYFSGLQIRFFAEHRVNQITVAVNRTV